MTALLTFFAARKAREAGARRRARHLASAPTNRRTIRETATTIAARSISTTSRTLDQGRGTMTSLLASLHGFALVAAAALRTTWAATRRRASRAAATIAAAGRTAAAHARKATERHRATLRRHDAQLRRWARRARNRHQHNRRRVGTTRRHATVAQLRRVPNPHDSERAGILTWAIGRRPDGRYVTRAWSGWYGLPMTPLPTSTFQAWVLSPFVTEHPIGATGRALIAGIDVHSGQINYHDGHSLYGDDLNSGNATITGNMGTGKSAKLKTDAVRAMANGTQVCVVDSKRQLRINPASGAAVYNNDGEWTPLAVATGSPSFRFDPTGNGVRINPLDRRIRRDRSAADAMQNRDSHREAGALPQGAVGQDTLVRSLLEVALRRRLTEQEHYAIHAAHELATLRAADDNRDPHLYDLFDALTDPDDDSARSIGKRAKHLKKWGLPVALTLHRMLKGDLAGIADGPTTPGLNFDAPLLHFDISAVPADTDALPCVMTIIGALINNVWLKPDGRRRLFIVDESWHIINHEPTAQLFRRLWKFTRALGVVNYAAFHRLSDLPGVDDKNTAARALIDEAQTHIMFQMEPENARMAGQQWHLPASVVERLPQLPKGHYILQVPGRAAREIALAPTEMEWPLIVTDEAMTGQTTAVWTPTPETVRA